MLRFSDYCHHISIGGELIIFDEKSAKYILVPKRKSTEIFDSLNSGSPSTSFVRALVDNNVLQLSETPFSGLRVSSGELGIGNYVWRLASAHKGKAPMSWIWIVIIPISILVLLKLKSKGLHVSLNHLRQKKRMLKTHPSHKLKSTTSYKNIKHC